MNHAEYSQKVREALRRQPATVPSIDVDDTKRRNAARCMAALACNRLAQAAETPVRVQYTTFHWGDGSFTLRNSRISDHFWSNVSIKASDKLHRLASRQPVAYLLIHWDVEQGQMHAWVVPEDVGFSSFGELPQNATNANKTIEIFLDNQQLKNAPSAPNFRQFYLNSPLTDGEIEKLLEAIKTDDLTKQERLAAETEEVEPESGFADADDEVIVDGVGYTDQTVAFLLELPAHSEDADWHEQNKKRYQTVLRDPSRRLVDDLRLKYIQTLSPVVAGGKRHLSILKKNDYGKGGYHNHYWFAFYDPKAGSKTRSVQLFVRLLGDEQVWRYGFSMGHYCDEYLERLLTTLLAHRQAVAKYVRDAPVGTIVRLQDGEDSTDLSPNDFAERLETDTDSTLGVNSALVNVMFIREFPLESLVGRADELVDEIGQYFLWNWPFFEAAVSGEWIGGKKAISKPVEDLTGDVDETAPPSIEKLAELTAMSEEFLNDLEEALWAKQQAVLVGPPGTSKTYIARQFARYFVRQRQGRPQGRFDVLYMHANWAYEDFFEGLKPVSKDGSLGFETRLGFFLQWVEQLKDFSPKALHVLILDEINRCDTAAVLGELLQLLEYRGTTVRLMSGRDFVFPRNLFIIGTMNSADRSIGRMDLALSRRFFWLDLHPSIATLERWLKRRGNNPLGFKASSLEQCNKLLDEHGIPPEQQIGHALFMLQRTAEDEDASPGLDKPLNEKRLRQVVRFSVLPYLRELLTMQFGHVDDVLLQQISRTLLECIPTAVTQKSTDEQNADSET